MIDDEPVEEKRHATAASGPLTDVERSVLEFARVNMRDDGQRDAAIRDLFGWSPTRHAQVVVALLGRPEALAYDAQTVRRLQRIREQRASRRSHGLAGIETRPDNRGIRPAFR